MTGCIIQARMSSSRLPGKVLKPVLRKPLLAHLIARLKKVVKSEISVIATTKDISDDVLEEFAKAEGIPLYRGSTDDVLDRYIGTASNYSIDKIVRICADTPIIDWATIDAMIEKLDNEGLDYCGIENENNFALTGVEVFTLDALKRQLSYNPAPFHKEHVSVIMRQIDDFKKAKVVPDKDLVTYDVRLTIDTKPDFELVKRVFEHFNSSDFKLKDAISFVRENSALKSINSHIIQKDIRQKSFSVALIASTVNENLKNKLLKIFTEKHHLGFEVIYVSLDDPHFDWAGFAEDASAFDYILYDEKIPGLTFTSPSKPVDLSNIDGEKVVKQIKKEIRLFL